jgi:isopenicillin-N epimerase
MPTPDWPTARAAMLLDPTIANLNTGSFGPLPRVVFERVTELRRELAAEPTHFLVRTMPPLLWQARERLASFLHADPQRLLFTLNVSAAINLVASGLRLSSPGEVLITDHEYGAMHWCWERACQRQGLALRTFALPTMPAEPGAIVEAAVRAMSSKTRLFFFSHVLSPTGLVLPAKELCAEARRRGILTLVDGAHAPAMRPLDVNAVNADFYAGNCHKWLLAPTGSGFLVLGPGSEDRLQPLEVSWGYHPDTKRPDERDEFGSTPRLRFLEFEGTRDPCPWLSVPAAIDFQAGIGWEQIRRRIAGLAAHARRRLSSELGLPLATPAQPALHGALTAFQLPFDGAENAVALRKAIWEHRIEVPIVERPDRLLLRTSTHFYNTEEEIDRLAEVLLAALKVAGG